MKAKSFNQIIAVLTKDLKSEIRTRYALSTVFLFVLTTITVILFGTAGENLTPGIASGIIWVIMFFSAMTGLSKSFVSEEERGTTFLLKLSASPVSVYFGKLIFNIILCLALNTFAILLFFLLIGQVEIKWFSIFILSHILGSIGIASASTIISAIISRANTKGALFPVLSLPVLLPLVMIGVEATRNAFEPTPSGSIDNNFRLMFAYCGLIITVSFFLFEFVWKD